MTRKEWRESDIQLLRDERGNQCQRLVAGVRCGTKLRFRRRKPNLQFAHVKPTPLSSRWKGRGTRERYWDIRRFPDSYLLLCIPHHREIDPYANHAGYGREA